MEPKYHHLLIILAIIFFLLGRISDDMNWYPFDGISADNFQGLAAAGLCTSLFFILIVRTCQKQGLKTILWTSQIKFIIPWSLVILLCYLIWQIFACYQHGQELQGQQMDYTGCIRYTVVLLLTNLNYSLICNELGELPLLITFQMTLFAEIIYSGFLLITFINGMKEKSKDYCILFISIFIAWQMLVMDLIFRASFEDKLHEERHQKLEIIVNTHHSKCGSLAETGTFIQLQDTSPQKILSRD